MKKNILIMVCLWCLLFMTCSYAEQNNGMKKAGSFHSTKVGIQESDRARPNANNSAKKQIVKNNNMNEVQKKVLKTTNMSGGNGGGSGKKQGND